VSCGIVAGASGSPGGSGGGGGGGGSSLLPAGGALVDGSQAGDGAVTITVGPSAVLQAAFTG